MYAAIKYATFLHCEVEDLVDMDEIVEETKTKAEVTVLRGQRKRVPDTEWLWLLWEMCQ